MMKRLLLVILIGCGPTARGPGATPDANSEPPGGGDGSGSGGMVGDPVTCADAATNRTYVGCDYWPTVTLNPVWSIFDYTVVVSNPGDNPAEVTITGPNNTHKMVTVMPGQVQKIYLPWVTSLKGSDADGVGQYPGFPTNSIYQSAGAYHMVSSVPVLAYQFNALEFQPVGGPPGKNWAACPNSPGTACFSYSNDASLLLPSTAMTGDYRIATVAGKPGEPSLVAITATQDNTTVQIRLSPTARVLADLTGTKIPAAQGGALGTYIMNTGDVAELVFAGDTSVDATGSLVHADKPVQVIDGSACHDDPMYACDHLEESVLPYETLGKDYVVTAPTGATDMGIAPMQALVRIVGNVDGTTLHYSPAIPGAPATLNAGQVIEFYTATDFEVTGDHEFIVAIVQRSASVGPKFVYGDPSLSYAIATEQYRLKYVFLAPDDWIVSFADVVAPMGAKLAIDGSPVTVAPTRVGTTTYGVWRLPLIYPLHATSGAPGGGHTLTSDQPASLQVEGYGMFASYQYPGGLNLNVISSPPLF
jgi:hypothetical protein